MNAKLIMVEGIQGSGKSTFAKRIAEWVKAQNIAVNLFVEGQPHPADLAWNACVPLDFLDNLILKYKEIEPEIRKNMRIEGDNALIAYTLVKTDVHDFFKDFEKFEVYDNRVSFDIFCKLHYSRWQTFVKQSAEKDELNIFECAFLQNHVSELMNFQLAGKEDIEKHLKKLISPALCLSPILVYLSPTNVKETIEHVAKERNFLYGRWIDAVITYTENTPYGKLHNLKGLDGVILNIENRKSIELDIIKTLPIKTIILENSNNDWDNIWQTLENYLRTV